MTPSPGLTPDALQRTVAFVQDLSRRKFFGTVVLKFEGGRIVQIRRDESILPNQLSMDEPGKHNNVKPQ